MSEQEFLSGFCPKCGESLKVPAKLSQFSCMYCGARLTADELLDITAVQYAILETDGNLSVFPFPKERPASAKDAGIHPKPQFLPVTIVEDGFLSRENLGRAGKDEAWLKQVLQEHRAEIADTLLLTLDAGNKVVWLGKEYGR